MSRKYKIGDRLAITWIDSGLATHLAGWHSSEDYHERISINSMKVETIGMYLMQDKHTLTVVASRARHPDTDSYVDATTVAKQCILKVRRL